MLRRSRTAAPAPAGTLTPVAMISPQEREFRKKLQELRDHPTSTPTVGEIPEEAQMHYGETSTARSRRGDATGRQELHEEGIEFHPLPVLPDERN